MEPGQSGEIGVPERIDEYRILRRVGAGGIGTVFEAEQDEPRRRVALKVLRAEVASPEILRRFELEAQALGSLHHPGVAQVYALGRFESASGTLPYIVLEFVDGEALTDYAVQYGLDRRQRLELLAAVCDAVQHAHQQGVIHRDLKPANILVEKQGQPKVLDFSVSHVAQEGQPESATLTRTGHVLGTLAYMSPEQARGERAIDTRSDVYSLGVIGYELLSGRLPNKIMELPLLEALQQIQNGPIPRLETMDRNLKGDLSIILGKALEPERERRYASAAALADDIRRFLSDQPISARPPTFTYQLSRFIRRNKALVAGSAFAITFLVVGLVFSLLSRLEEVRQREVAEQKTLEANRAAYAAQVQAAMAYCTTGDDHSASRRLSATNPDLRGWEWDYLTSSLQDVVAMFPMNVLSRPWPTTDPAGKHALFAVDNRTLRLFDLPAGTWRDVIVEEPFPHVITLLADGRSVLYGAQRGSVWLKDLEGRREPRRVCEFNDLLSRTRLSPDREIAIVVDFLDHPHRSSIQLVDLKTLTVKRRLTGLPLVIDAALNPD
ncbi:MAG: serine/threonine protein kinase, partial [Planctomycetota bacterium]